MHEGTALTASSGSLEIKAPSDVPVGKRVPVRVTHYSGPTKLFLRYRLPDLHDAADNDAFFIEPGASHVSKIFVGMYCLVCKVRSAGVALRALVKDVQRNLGTPWTVKVYYVDNGQTDFVALDFVYAIDGEAAAEPCRAVACYIRGLRPTRDSTHFDLQHLSAERDPLYGAAFHRVSDTGAYEIDLYVKCPGTKVGLEMLNVRDLLIQNGYARPLVYLGERADKEVSQITDEQCQRSRGEHSQERVPEKPSCCLPLSSTQPKSTASSPGAESSTGNAPEENSLEIEITLVCTPEFFYGHNIFAAEDMSEIRCVMKTCTEKCSEGELVRGAHCIYRHKPEETGARAWVEAVGSRRCRVFLMDYGDRKTVRSSRLYKTDPRLVAIDPLALRFQLVDSQPWAEWTEDVVSRFDELIRSDATLTAVLTGTKSTGDDFDKYVYVVKLFSEKHGNVAECLAREGYARLRTEREKRNLLVPTSNPALPPSGSMKEGHESPLNSASVNKDNPGVANITDRHGRRI